MSDFLLIFFSGILIGGLISISWFRGSDAPYVPTKSIRIKKIIELVKLKRGEVFYELGSGDGRVVMEAAKLGANAVGIEQSLIRVLLSRWKARNLPNAHFIHGDIFHLLSDRKQNEIRDANVIFIFLLPKGVGKLEPLLKKNLKKGTRIITQTFHFKTLKPYKKILISDKNSPNSPLGKNVY
jgi:SAM-dependent methyltransferase